MPRESALDGVATSATQVSGDDTAEQLAQAGVAIEGPDVDLQSLDHADSAAPPGLRTQQPSLAQRMAARRSQQRPQQADEEDEGLWFSTDPRAELGGGAYDDDDSDDEFGRPEVLPEDTSTKPELVAKYLSLVRCSFTFASRACPVLAANSCKPMLLHRLPRTKHCSYRKHRADCYLHTLARA